MIDPSHGGDDYGTVLPNKALEKDVTLALARELRRQLGDRGIPARLLRESDVNLGLDRRAEVTNQEHPGLYVAFHAGAPGTGVRVYSAALPSTTSPATASFLAWDNAQSGALAQSRIMARAVANELRKSGMQVNLLTAPLRPMNNLIIPAISVEWAPGPRELKTSENARISIKLASSVAAAIADLHESAGARP